MTIQTIFDRMMLYGNSLDLIAAGDEVTRGLAAVNLAQDWFEMEAAHVGGVLQTVSTFTTTASQEYTDWPTGLLRLDALWLLDANSNQIRKVRRIQGDGDHTPDQPWPLSALTLTPLTQGAPCQFDAKGQGGQFRWIPRPDAEYTLRGYGLWAATDYTAAANTFGRPDSVALAIAPFAAKLMQLGLDRDLEALHADASRAFRRVISLMGNQVDDGPDSRVYDDEHDT